MVVEGIIMNVIYCGQQGKIFFFFAKVEITLSSQKIKMYKVIHVLYLERDSDPLLRYITSWLTE